MTKEEKLKAIKDQVNKIFSALIKDTEKIVIDNISTAELNKLKNEKDCKEAAIGIFMGCCDTAKFALDAILSRLDKKHD